MNKTVILKMPGLRRSTIGYRRKLYGSSKRRIYRSRSYRPRTFRKKRVSFSYGRRNVYRRKSLAFSRKMFYKAIASRYRK